MSDITDYRKEMIEKYPFMSYITYGGEGYLRGGDEGVPSEGELLPSDLGGQVGRPFFCAGMWRSRFIRALQSEYSPLLSPSFVWASSVTAQLCVLFCARVLVR